MSDPLGVPVSVFGYVGAICKLDKARQDPWLQASDPGAAWAGARKLSVDPEIWLVTVGPWRSLHARTYGGILRKFTYCTYPRPRVFSVATGRHFFRVVIHYAPARFCWHTKWWNTAKALRSVQSPPITSYCCGRQAGAGRGHPLPQPVRLNGRRCVCEV